MADLPALPAGYDFHHLGYATTSIEKDASLFQFIGYAQEGADFSDPVQGVAGRFMVGTGPRIELLENLPGSETLTPWLNAGIKLYHFAYEVADIEAALAWAASQRAKTTVFPVPAIAFGGRYIAFVMFRNGLMLEFIEKTLRSPRD